MKKPSIDSASIKNFFLFHCEKLILALSIVLLGLFFWLGFSTSNYDKSTPSKLIDKSSQTNRYITSADAWDSISKFRDGDDEVDERISNVQPVDASLFDIGPTSYPVKRDALRKDAPLESPIRIVAIPFRAPIIVRPQGSDGLPIKVTDPLAKYPPVQPEFEGDDSNPMGGMGGMGMGMGGMGLGMGGRGGGEDENDDGMGMGMGMGMFGGNEGSNDRRRRREPKEDPVDAGTYVSAAIKSTFDGIRQPFMPTDVRPYNVAGVAVTGLIEHKKMWQNFKNIYKDSFAYHPERDAPQYDFVQVQRRTVAADGTKGEWKDISEKLYEQADLFPDNFNTAPEIVPPSAYDGTITQPIPPFHDLDYTKIGIHPDVAMREFEIPEVTKEQVTEGDFQSDIGNDSEDSDNGVGSGRRRRGALGGQSGMGGMGMDGMGMGGMGMGGMGMDGMGGGMGMDGMGGLGMGGLFGGGSNSQGRIASDYSKYNATGSRKAPKSDHKVVRFFDIYGVKAAASYEYRVRVWIRDPNNEDPELAKMSGMGGDGSMGGPGMGMGGPGMGMGGPGMGMGGPGMGMGGPAGGRGGNRGSGRAGTGRGGAGDNEDEEDEGGDGTGSQSNQFIKKQSVASNMIHPSARERLSLAREEKDDDGNKTYYVSERHGENGEFVEIQVPKKMDFLRYARPTKWSDITEVTIDKPSSFVYVGEPVELRKIAFDNGEIADKEPSIMVAAGKYIEKGQLSGIKVPFKTEVQAGEMLSFDSAAHVLHPITWQVHKVSDVPINTEMVVIDVSSGDKLDLKKSSPIDYFFPGETLVLDPLGNIEFRNDLDDRRKYLAATFAEDDKAEFGSRRRRKKSDENFGGMGGPGMGMGGPGMGMGGPGMGGNQGDGEDGRGGGRRGGR